MLVYINHNHSLEHNVKHFISAIYRTGIRGTCKYHRVIILPYGPTIKYYGLPKQGIHFSVVYTGKLREQYKHLYTLGQQDMHTAETRHAAEK